MRIKQILKDKGLTVAALAKKIGISRQALGKQVQGKLHVDTAQRIADALEVPVWKLFASEEEILGERDKNTISSDFIAFIKRGDKIYFTSDITEARAILDKDRMD